MSQKEKVSFGFQEVKPDEKTHLVGDVFHRVASRYDLMNDLMSLGLHRLWKHELIKMIRPRPHMQLLDVGGGTGDIAFRFHEASRAYPEANVTVCDINSSMIQVGRDRAIDQGYLQNINWVVGDASNLPFPDHFADVYSISFALRNVTDIEAALRESYRVLKPGGMFLCLEFSKVTQPLFNKLYEMYSFSWLPKLGSFIADDQAAYQYLVESIAVFPSQEELAQKIEHAGLSQVAYHNFSGGVVALHSGIKK